MKSEEKPEKIKKPEVLAPAGGLEHLKAAVRSGADAVYLGSVNFNARRNAQNFDAESLKQAVSYCHIRGVKVYVTLNTLVFDREIDELADEIKLLADCAADGVIVQDLGVASIVKETCPSLPLHASTQMTIHNLSGASALEKLGFSRVVLARELSAKEIETIAGGTSLELEVFVHGALCMSVSGQCYLSSMLGGRSGNRGLCAQPCRLNFKSGAREFALSLKDLSLIGQMEQLKKLGIAALKIEGRMKRPEYVAAAVTACKQAIEGVKPDMETLRAVFSRSGFTDGYFTAKRDLSMFGSRTREDVLAAAPVLEKIALSYREEKPLVPVNMEFRLYHDVPAVLKASDGVNTVIINGPVPETAIRKALNEETALRSLGKTGGTPFFLDKLHTEIQDGLTVSVAAMNHMRKDVLSALETKRGLLHPLPFKAPSKPFNASKPLKSNTEIRIRILEFSQISDEMINYAAKIILPVEEIAAHLPVIKNLGQKLIGEMPLMVFPSEEPNLCALLNELKAAGLENVTAGNPGAFKMAKNAGFGVHGDYSLNVMNSYALGTVAASGFASQTLSFETGLRQAKGLRSSIPYGVIAYGYLPLMTYRNCPVKTKNGCGSCTGISSIIDRMQNAFPVLCRRRSYSQLLNAHPLYLADKQDDLVFDFITLYFTFENRGQCQAVIQQYKTHAAPEGRFTRGLYFNTLK